MPGAVDSPVLEDTLIGMNRGRSGREQSQRCERTGLSARRNGGSENKSANRWCLSLPGYCISPILYLISTVSLYSLHINSTHLHMNIQYILHAVHLIGHGVSLSRGLLIRFHLSRSFSRRPVLGISCCVIYPRHSVLLQCKTSRPVCDGGR